MFVSDKKFYVKNVFNGLQMVVMPWWNLQLILAHLKTSFLESQVCSTVSIVHNYHSQISPQFNMFMKSVAPLGELLILIHTWFFESFVAPAAELPN